MKSVWKKDFGALRPADPEAEEWLKKVAQGESVMMEARRPRNLKHHRKFYALVKVALDNWPERLDKISKDALVGVLKIQTGHCEPVETRDGVVKIPKSINFESMCQSKFDSFYQESLEILARILNTDPETLDRESRE